MGKTILGISAFYHDSAAAITRDGEIVAAAQEERFSRRKHDPRFPARAVNYCLEEAFVEPSELAAVVFYDTPLLTFDRLVKSLLTVAPAGEEQWVKASRSFLGIKAVVREHIRRALGCDVMLLFGDHHTAHAAAAFFPSPFDEAAILTVDGVGEWATLTLGRGKVNHVELLKEVRYPHSLGLLYSAFTYHCGFKVNSGEYKLMGLAPFGRPVYQDLIHRELIDLKADGSFRLNMRYFNYCQGLTMTNGRFDRLFGAKPRRPEASLEQRHMDVAASIQAVTEEVMLRMAQTLHRATGLPNLVLAGGVALNCVANGRVQREGPFERIWIQPAAGDAGGALGAALFVWHHLLDKPRRHDGKDAQQGSLLGPAF